MAKKTSRLKRFCNFVLIGLIAAFTLGGLVIWVTQGFALALVPLIYVAMLGYILQKNYSKEPQTVGSRFTYWLVVCFLILCLGLGATIVGPYLTVQRTPVEESPTTGAGTTAPAASMQWYEGGTLHAATAIDWQQAGYSNKLATCGDIVAKLWQNRTFKPSIQSQLKTMDDVRKFADELVTQMDDALAVNPDPATNEQIYKNQTVAGTASLLMASMGWI